ncbi:MAG: hotdog domain-containing protein [Candidatus Kariarchaeaceae archaeon]|jgi:uncharacterized protein (TIGR00369 family)
MDEEDHFRNLEKMYHNHRLNSVFNAKLSISRKIAIVEIPVGDHLFHAANAVHGSVYFKALDDAAFFAANSIVKDVFVLTTSFNIYLTRPISNGYMKAVGKLVNYNNTQYIAEAILYNSENKEIGRGSGLYVKSKMQLTEELGYR